MQHIFTIEEGKIIEYEVEPNPLLEGWSILTNIKPNAEGYCSIFPIMNEALERNRFDSIKKAGTYAGLGNIVYYNSQKEAQEVLNLQKQFKKIYKDA
jgi:hypothetical protein